jgi:hypothetical protein
MLRVFVMGLGPRRVSSAGLGSALEEAARTLSRAKVEAVALEVPGAGVLDDQVRASAVTSQFLPKFKGKSVAILGERSLAKLIPGLKSEK